MDAGRIERAAIRALENYIDNCPKLSHYILHNDKAPFWDGDIYVYQNEVHTIKNFTARVPLQIIGTGGKKTFYTIGREYLERYKADRGCIFFMVQVDKEGQHTIILYNILSIKFIDTLLYQSTKTIKIDLKELPENHLDFENEVIEFAEERNQIIISNQNRIENIPTDIIINFETGDELENSKNDHLTSCLNNPSEIEQLANNYKDIADYYDDVKRHREAETNYFDALNLYFILADSDTLRLSPDSFKRNKNKSIDKVLEILNKLYSIHILLRDYSKAEQDNSDALFYYKELLKNYSLKGTNDSNSRFDYGKIIKDFDVFIINNLAYLYRDSANLGKILGKYKEAENNYNECLEIFKILKNNKEQALTLAELADLFSLMDEGKIAETIFKEALNIFNRLDNISCPKANAIFLKANHYARNNIVNKAKTEYFKALRLINEIKVPEEYNSNKTKVLLALARLYEEKKTNEAKNSYEQAFNLYDDLVKKDPEAYLADFINALNNYALIARKIYKKAAVIYKEAEKRYKRVLKCYTSEWKNKFDLKDDIAVVHRNLAIIYLNLRRFDDAEKEYAKELFTRREIAESTPEKNKEVAFTLLELAKLHTSKAQYSEAKKEYEESLDIFQNLTDYNSCAFKSEIATIHNNLGNFYSRQSLYTEAVGEFETASKIFLELAKNTKEYDLEVAEAHENIASLLSENIERIEEAIIASKIAKDYYIKLINDNHQKENRYSVKIKRLESNLIELEKRKEFIFISSVKEYINNCSQLELNIFQKDKTPLWDGELFVYQNELHTRKTFYDQVPLMIKKTGKKENYFRFKRELVNGIKGDRGYVILMIQVDENEKTKNILYNILSSETLDALLKQDAKTIKIGLNKMPENPHIFEKEVIDFVKERNGGKKGNPATKGIELLVKKFDEVGELLKETKVFNGKHELEAILHTITKIKNEEDVLWRDKFVYYSQKFLELAIKNINYSDFFVIQYELGRFLHNQKLYHLVEDYYSNALNECRERVKEDPDAYMGYTCKILNSLGTLHHVLNRFNEAEEEYKEALDIRRKLAEERPDVYMGDVATTLNSLATLHSDINRLVEAEEEHKEALDIRRKLAEEKPDVYMGDVAMTLNDLGLLHAKLNRPFKAVEEFKKALDIRRKLAKENPDVYMGDVAATLNNLAILNEGLSRHEKADAEYKEALQIRQMLAQDNPNAYMGDVATTLDNLAQLHSNLNRPIEAEGGYKEALDIRRKLAKDNPNAYMGDVATTLNNLALLHAKLNRPDEAEEEYKEALEIYKKLAKGNPTAYMGLVAMTYNDIAVLYSEIKLLYEAETAYKEALEIYKELVKDNPATYMDDVTTTLNNLAILHEDLNRPDEAEEEYKEALAIYRKLAEDNPDAYMGEVANTLCYLGLLLKDANRYSEAKKSLEEALQIYQTIEEVNSQILYSDVNTIKRLLNEIEHHDL